jgi:DNA-binding response OmpR family regulator
LSGVSSGVKSLLRKPFPLGELIAQVEKYVPRDEDAGGRT